MTLQELRRSKAYSQLEIATACKITTTTVSAWERGTAKPRLTHIRCLADALGVTITDIESAITKTQAKKRL